METASNQNEPVNDFYFHGFINQPNFEQFTDLIRGENNESILKFCPNYDCDHISGSLDDNYQFGGNPFDFNVTANSTAAAMSFPNPDFDALMGVDVRGVKDVEELENEVGEESSETTTTITTNTQTKRKAERARTLTSERRRRGRMKEKLYALRALVPNITKMDKASIVGDALAYLQQLQMQAKKLRAEISGLESSLAGGDRPQQAPLEDRRDIQFTNSSNPRICKKIIQMDMFQVEERGFYVKLESYKGQGVAASLYKVLESLSRFSVQNSNLTTLADRYILTFTLKVGEGEPDMNLPNLKLWVTGALLNKGFEF